MFKVLKREPVQMRRSQIDSLIDEGTGMKGGFTEHYLRPLIALFVCTHYVLSIKFTKEIMQIKGANMPANLGTLVQSNHNLHWLNLQQVKYTWMQDQINVQI